MHEIVATNVLCSLWRLTHSFTFSVALFKWWLRTHDQSHLPLVDLGINIHTANPDESCV